MTMLDKAAVSYQVILTKADKARPTELTRALEATKKELSAHPAAHPFIIATSSRTGSGIEEMRARIATLADLMGMR
jgi:GTP-binding protein